jgi:adenosine deaminase
MSRDGRWLRALPKVELHRHLDGSVRIQTIWDIASEAGLDIGARTLEELRQVAVIRTPVSDLAQALARFETQRKVLHSFAAISRVTRENIEDAWRDGVRLLELRFAPAFIAEGTTLSNDEIIGGVLDGLLKGMEEFRVEVGLIGILPRGYPVSVNHRALDDLLRWKESGARGADRICGLDLAAMEAGIDPLPFVPLVNRARDAGLGITVHSGEDTDAAHIARTLNLFRPSRIGHGIRAWGSAAVLGRLKAENVHLEVCPTSNWLTGAVPVLAEHPLPRLWRAGISVSINSDDPNLMGIDLVNEYEVCARHYGFQEKDFKAINQEAREHSFLHRVPGFSQRAAPSL